jgi:hypothetical protein
MLDALIEGLKPDLVEGADARIRNHFAQRSRSPQHNGGSLAEALCEFLATDFGKRCLRYDYKPPKDVSPLRHTLSRFTQLDPSKLDALAASLELELGHTTTADQWREIARRIDNPAFLRQWGASPPPVPGVDRLRKILGVHFAEWPESARDRIARELGPRLCGSPSQSDEAVAARVASDFRLRPLAAKYGVEAVEQGDPRLVDRSPRRDASTRPRGSLVG